MGDKEGGKIPKVEEITKPWEDFLCPGCEQEYIRISLLHEYPTTIPLQDGQIKYIDEDGKTQILMLAFLRCPNCDVMFLVPGEKSQ